MSFKSEIRDSIIRELIEKTRKNNYKEYLFSIRLEKIRKFKGAQITFDFPVTALIGPNGGGKSTIIGSALLAYQTSKPSDIFRKSKVGDESMNDWVIEYEVIDKNVNTQGTERFNITLRDDKWIWSNNFKRVVKFLSINRTVPIAESSSFSYRKKMSFGSNENKKSPTEIKFKQAKNIEHIKKEAERILGKSLSNFTLYEFNFKTIKKQNKYDNKLVGIRKTDDGTEIPIYKKRLVESIEKGVDVGKQLLYVGSDGVNTYSEFNFGSGETSIIRMVAEMEDLPDGALVLIEEIENGLHPVAVLRVVEYFIDLAHRKKIQIIFTTHSDYAIAPLPSEAIWACIEGRLQQGKLSIEALRAISGRIDRKLVIFVEDDFAKSWLEYIVREELGNNIDQIGVYPVGGDGNAVKVHEGHINNPSVTNKSICFIDGDSKQGENHNKRIFRLPGESPESSVFKTVISNLENNIALLTVACQRTLGQQGNVAECVREISRTNRDPHLLFSQIGFKLGFVSTEIIKGAFLSVWVQENREEVERICAPIREILSYE